MYYWTEGLCLCTWLVRFEPFTSDGQEQGLVQQVRDCKFTCKLLCYKCSFCYRVATKEGVNPNYCHNYTELKYVKDVSCVGHLNSVNLVTNVPTAAIDLPVGARLHRFWKKMGNPGGESKGSNNTQKGLHPPLPVQTQPN